jgi:hypothetical protein
VCSVFYQFSPIEKRFTYDATFKRKVILSTEKIRNHAAVRKYAVSEACKCHWQSIKTKLFSYLRNRKSFCGTRKGKYPEIDVYLKDLQNKGLHVTQEAVMSKAKKKKCAGTFQV